MSQTDSGIYKPFIWVLGALVLFTFIIAIIANKYSPKSDAAADPLVQQGLKRQIAPVGQSRVAENAVTTSDHADQSDADADDARTDEQNGEAEETANVEVEETTAEATAPAAEVAVAATTAVAAAAGVVTSEAEVAPADSSPADIPVKVRAVVATNCAGCHQQGVSGAPKSDDKAAWDTLAEKGIDALTQSVIAGKGAMMPRAESTLTDDELALAVRHMVAQNTGGVIAGGTTGESMAEPEAVSAEAEVATEAEPSATAATEAAETSVAVAATATATVAAQEPVPDNVKSVVDSLCAGCHISGVANAPKFGDAAAWEQRLSGGIDKVLAIVIAGKGAMPARGGSQLSDTELRFAIEYMATK